LHNHSRPTEQHRKALADDLPHVGTPEFDMRVEQAMKKVCEKYAWTAQHGGMVLRRNPLKMQPLQDYIFLRIASRAPLKMPKSGSQNDASPLPPRGRSPSR
jgi:hypothetical protein